MTKKMIRVRARPSFPCLRRGFVRQLSLLTPKGIDASQHGPFTVISMLNLYKNVAVEMGSQSWSRKSGDEDCRLRWTGIIFGL